MNTHESQYIKEVEGNSIDDLNILIKEHGLKQSDLSEIGSQGVVSEILSGKRQLNIRPGAKILILTTKPASAIRKVTVCINACSPILGCGRSRYTIHRFRLIRTENRKTLIIDGLNHGNAGQNGYHEYAVSGADQHCRSQHARLVGASADFGVNCRLRDSVGMRVLDRRPCCRRCPAVRLRQIDSL